MSSFAFLGGHLVRNRVMVLAIFTIAKPSRLGLAVIGIIGLARGGPTRLQHYNRSQLAAARMMAESHERML
jgi:hypothetical protein